MNSACQKCYDVFIKLKLYVPLYVFPIQRFYEYHVNVCIPGKKLAKTSCVVFILHICIYQN